ncbi:MAG: hypothetical protein JWN22_1582 [Nocardioides sp.]|nr:hypothetical protein [Nocardioides sp.]
MTGPRDRDTLGQRRAWGWVAHLRAGGATPWRDWTNEGEPRGRVLPGAQQLELLRRLNAAGTPGPDLVERTLSASAPGRGRSDLELLGAVEPLAFGPPPVDPGELRDDELLRVATGLLAEDVAAAGLPEEHPPTFVRPWRTRYRLQGDPELADPIRAQLVARGRPPGGRGSTVLVLGDHLDRMVVDAWTAGCFDEGAAAWGTWLGSRARRDALPPRIDLPHVAGTWAGRVGHGRVRIVLDPAAVPGLVGVRRAFIPPESVPADGIELGRRIATTLGLLVPRDRRRALLRHTVRPRLAAQPGPRLAVPPEHADWLQRRAVGMREAVRAAGYPVQGDPDRLLPAPVDHGRVVVTSETGALALAVRLLLGDDGKEWL